MDWEIDEKPEGRDRVTGGGRQSGTSSPEKELLEARTACVCRGVRSARKFAYFCGKSQGWEARWCRCPSFKWARICRTI